MRLRLLIRHALQCISNISFIRSTGGFGLLVDFLHMSRACIGKSSVKQGDRGEGKQQQRLCTASQSQYMSMYVPCAARVGKPCEKRHF
jgi:hypothetical protein